MFMRSSLFCYWCVTIVLDFTRLHIFRAGRATAADGRRKHRLWARARSALRPRRREKQVVLPAGCILRVR